MDLQPVTGKPFTAECQGCHEKKLFGDPTGVDAFNRPLTLFDAGGFADLDGEPFIAYYCNDCAAKMRHVASAKQASAIHVTRGDDGREYDIGIAAVEPTSDGYIIVWGTDYNQYILPPDLGPGKSVQVIRGDDEHEYPIEIHSIHAVEGGVNIVGADYSQYFFPHEVFGTPEQHQAAEAGRKCEQCGKEFTPQSDANRFCCKECYRASLGPKTAAPAEQVVERTEPAAEEPLEEPEADVRGELEATLSNEATVQAVIEFLAAEKLGYSDVEVSEGFSNWSEAADFAHVEHYGTEWFVAPSAERADELAAAMVKDELEADPDAFRRDFVENYIDEEQLRDALTPDVEVEIRRNPNSYGWEEPEEEEPEEDQIGLDFDAEQRQREAEQSFDDWVERTAADLLRNPVDYLRDIYGGETLKRAIEIAGIDADAAAGEAVRNDGWEYYLAKRDGHGYELPSGGVYWWD